MVVASAITSGRKLLAISRKLRSIDKHASITYIVGVSKVQNDGVLNQLKTDLRQGGHELIIIEQCLLPRSKNHHKTAWDAELEKLSKYDNDDFASSGNLTKLTNYLQERLDFLKKNQGEENSLFLKRPTKAVLKLRPSFVFWLDIGLDTGKATQADVYWTIQSLLHDLRMKSDETGLASTYHSTLISPVCFDRYNDGIIQAALLRSASPTELNYQLDDRYSRQMTDIVLSIIENWEEDHGEASLEFLMALWTRRLKLLDAHLKEIIQLIESKTNCEEFVFFGTALKSQICCAF